MTTSTKTIKSEYREHHGQGREPASAAPVQDDVPVSSSVASSDAVATEDEPGRSWTRMLASHALQGIVSAGIRWCLDQLCGG
jgi:hypothetical protein